VNPVVLSGTALIVPSGTRSSCYREPESTLTFSAQSEFRESNFTNKESNLLREPGRLIFAVGPIGLRSAGSKQLCKSDLAQHALRTAIGRGGDAP
jgi:hypothetical protein